MTPRRRWCLVPFCRHSTTRSAHEEWICAEHWRLLPARKRRAYLRALRRAEKAVMVGRVGELSSMNPRKDAAFRIAGRWRIYQAAQTAELFNSQRAADRLWRYLKAKAIERAVGI